MILVNLSRRIVARCSLETGPLLDVPAVFLSCLSMVSKVFDSTVLFSSKCSELCAFVRKRETKLSQDECDRKW